MDIAFLTDSDLGQLSIDLYNLILNNCKPVEINNNIKIEIKEYCTPLSILSDLKKHILNIPKIARKIGIVPGIMGTKQGYILKNMYNVTKELLNEICSLIIFRVAINLNGINITIDPSTESFLIY